MFHVQTVSGPIAPDALGHSQIHEHIFVHRTPMAEKNPALRLDDPARSLEELRAYRAAGEASGGRPARGRRTGCRAPRRAVGRAARRWRPLPATICWAFTRRTAGSTAWMRRACTTLYCGELLEGMLPWRPERTAARRSRRPFGRAW